MAAPKGNKYALGCQTSGAPRTVSPTKVECIELGKHLVKWAKEEDKKDPHTRFAQWYSLEKEILRKHWKTLIQREEFVPYYEGAQAALAKRVMDPKVMDKSFGNRFIRCYDKELVESENEEVAFKAQAAKKQEEENQDDSIRKLAQALKELEKEDS